MNKMVSLFIFSRILALLIIPALFSIITIFKILNMRKKNGSVILKKRTISWFSLFMFIAGSLIFSFLINREYLFVSLSIYVFSIIIFYGAYFEKFVESLECGIYEQGIVYPGYTSSWNDIEGFIDKNPIIRLINIKKGAFDFKIDNDDFYKYVEKIQNHAVLINK